MKVMTEVDELAHQLSRYLARAGPSDCGNDQRQPPNTAHPAPPKTCTHGKALGENEPLRLSGGRVTPVERSGRSASEQQAGILPCERRKRRSLYRIGPTGFEPATF